MFVFPAPLLATPQAKAAVPDPEDADAVEAARDAFCESFSLLSERTKTVTNEEGEAVEEPYFSTILDKSVEQVLGAGELRCRTFSSTSQAVTSYRKKMTTENADSGGQVVLYEMDLGSIAGVPTGAMVKCMLIFCTAESKIVFGV